MREKREPPQISKLRMQSKLELNADNQSRRTGREAISYKTGDFIGAFVGHVSNNGSAAAIHVLSMEDICLRVTSQGLPLLLKT